MATPLKPKFCPKDNQLLYAEEDSKARKLRWACRSCDHVEYDDNDDCAGLVQRKIYAHAKADTSHAAPWSSVDEVAVDPALPRTHNVACAQCGGHESAYSAATSTEGVALWFVCLGCHHTWRHDA